MKKFLFFILLIAAAVGIFAYAAYSRSLHYSRNPAGDARVMIVIEPGSTAESIAQQLKSEGLIPSELAFQLYLRQKGLSDQLKAATVIIEENKTLPEIVDILVQGQSQEMKVTLLEGWTAREIGKELEKEGLTTQADFMNCIENCSFAFDYLPSGYLEGYLYPDTYFVDPATYTDESFIKRLLETFNAKLTNEDWEGIDDSGYTLEDIIIMASMIEREERVDSEKATVAGVLWNRFDQGTLLGVDATVLYALDRTSGPITYEDLQVDSPFNTRKYAGMPPAPISNPNISSIRAAIFPEETDYWYYLHDAQGQIHYAKTLQGHNDNKAKYLD